MQNETAQERRFDLSLTINEGQVLINLLNVAVKAVGLEGAEAVVTFAKRISDASKEKEPTDG